jgi:DNA-binding PadR family transcriptional regulator
MSSDEAVLAVIAALERYNDRSGAQLMKITGLWSGSLYPALASLEQCGMIYGCFVDGRYPRRRIYRLASRATTAGGVGGLG